MELFGIVLSIPVAFVASTLYCLLLAKVLSKSATVCRFLQIVSFAVLTLFGVEILLLVTIGAARSRGLLGPGFYIAHVVFFFLCTPALANILVLQKKYTALSKWWVAGVICTIFAFGLVLLQYSVSEALYGIDGDDGPYSSLDIQTLSS